MLSRRLIPASLLPISFALAGCEAADEWMRERIPPPDTGTLYDEDGYPTGIPVRYNHCCKCCFDRDH
jgi:hypothetical protein